MADPGRVPPPDPTGTGTPVALVPPPLTRIPVRPGDVFLEPGYVLEPVAAGFTYPTDLEWDERGRLHVVEAGYSYGPAKAAASGRVLRIEEDGSVVEVASGFRPPVTGIAFLDGFLYVAEGGNPGRITRVAADGSRQVIVDGLRSGADHFTGELVAGPDGRLYFGVGTATNSAVVGVDNFVFGWLPDLPSFHDVPARDLVLRGNNFATVDTGAPATHPDVIATGFRGVRLNLATGALRSFLVNLRPGPEGTGVERPIDVRFDPAGETLYVLDFGVVEANAAGIIPWAQSGILWRIRRQAG